MNLLRFPVVFLGFGLGIAACSDESTPNDSSTTDVGVDVATDVRTDRGGGDVVATDVPVDSGTADVAVDAPMDVAGDVLADVSVDTGSDVTASDADNPLALRCTSTGGTVQMSLCCSATPDFPSACLTGACGCAPSSSHMVQVCQCPGDTCFDPTVGCRAR